jgi:hypothetical protein
VQLVRVLLREFAAKLGQMIGHTLRRVIDETHLYGNLSLQAGRGLGCRVSMGLVGCACLCACADRRQ